MLTRNLYREEEVVASMQFCILRGRCVEAAFWATEMIESSMTAEFFSALRIIWQLGFGIAALPWFSEFTRVEALDELETDVLLSLVVGLARSPRDITYLVMAGSKAPPEQVGLCMVPRGLAGVDAFFAAAIIQGRTVTAWRALPSIGEGIMALVAKHKHGEAGGTLLTMSLEPALIIGALCLPREELQRRLEQPVPGMLDEVVDALTEWDSLKGRGRRLYTVPQESLYLITVRGNTTVYETADANLRGSLERPGKLWGSVFWDSVAEDLGGWLAVRSDTATREVFYDEYFPNDIPDEWSLAERAKSHGGGCLQPGTTASVDRFLRTWFGRHSSAVIWNEFPTDMTVKKLADISAPVGVPVELNLRRAKRLVTECLQSKRPATEIP
jgi:hypothetical protein